jgi:purine catabolism regulator
MGIRIRDILEDSHFKNFKVIAGHAGLDNQLQGCTLFEAPDGYLWGKGRELILSSGYVPSAAPEEFKKFCHSDYLGTTAAFGMKMRYLPEVPAEYLECFNEKGVPFIVIPDEISWMDLVNQINVLVINRNIQKFQIHAEDPHKFSNVAYSERKINRILKTVESEMGFPAMVYDVSTRKEYYSSARFKRDYPYPFRIEDFWEPSFSYTRHLMCETLQMARYRFRDEEVAQGKPPFSWITVPIIVGSIVKAYFVIMESRDLIDYYDEFAVRIAVLLLQSIYEQIVVSQSLSNQGFESFITYAIGNETVTESQLFIHANALNIKVQKKYFYAMIRQVDDTVALSDYRDEIKNVLKKSFTNKNWHFAVINENECMLLIEAENEENTKNGAEVLYEMLMRFSTKLEIEIPLGEFRYSFYEERTPLLEVKRCYERCERALELGPALFPKEKIWRYQKMGALAWLNIPADEVDMMFREFLPALQDEKNAETIKTLKIYLENNMNYSLTAQKMYLHINTIRKRIDRAQELFQIDWEDAMSRMKMELMLQILQF